MVYRVSPMYYSQQHSAPLALCGCWYVLPHEPHYKNYLPQVQVDSSTTILSCTSRTKLVQRFLNTNKSNISKAQYTFPLYDGVSVVAFKYTVGDRTVTGIVKEKEQARTDYQEALERGETAGLLEQLSDAGDVFNTKIANIPAGGIVSVEIVYIGELKHDTESDGIRFTIPTAIAPRYGNVSQDTQQTLSNATQGVNKGGMSIMIDVATEEGSAIRGVQSPSHPIAVTLGRNAAHDEDVFQNNLASATLSLSGKTELDKDFIIIVKAQNQDTPRALLETHDTIPNRRALMTTLVPKFNLPNAHPEIVFVVDRSGSMSGKIPLVVQALKIFLKSLPTSAKFNICSFGSLHSFLFPKSKPYDQASLKEALSHVDTFQADYGGTEMLAPIKQICKQRLSKETALEIMLLTDGEIWNQQELFDFINDASKQKTRVFSLGIGSGASSALVEGMARAGNGFSQFVHDGEQIDKRVVRMLKAALTPFVSDYSLRIVYEAEDMTDIHTADDDYEIIESFTESLKTVVGSIESKPKKSISLFSSVFKEESTTNKSAGKYDHLPPLDTPKVLQAPHEVPQLYSFSRTTVYLLLGPEACQRKPQKVILNGTTEHGPLELEIPVQDMGRGQTIHQLAAKKATQDLEEGRGWITQAKTDKGKLLKTKLEADWERLVEREAVKLGTQFQIVGKYCSFVAVEANGEDSEQQSSEQAISVEANKAIESMPKTSFASPPQLRQKKMAIVPAFSSMSFGRRATPAGGLFGSAAPRRSSGGSGGGMFASAVPGGSSLFGSPAPSMASPPPPPPAPVSWRPSQALATSTFSAPSPDRHDGERRSQVFRKEGLQKPAMQAQQHVYADEEDEEDEAADEGFGMIEPDMATSFGGHGPRVVRSSEANIKSPEAIMHAIIGLQEFDGSWRQVDDLLSIIGISKEVFSKGIASVQSDIVKATSLALAWLQTKVPKERDTWDMVVDKARSWIVSQDGINDAESLIEMAGNEFL